MATLREQIMRFTPAALALALLAGVALFLVTSHLAPHQHGG